MEPPPLLDYVVWSPKAIGKKAMSDTPTERRLAAILVADVYGYSRMMGEDEIGTPGTALPVVVAALRGRQAVVVEDVTAL